MLKAIKQVVTKSANPAVHRMNFVNLMQHENELIKDFLVQLCSMAVDCEFICEFPQSILEHQRRIRQWFEERNPTERPISQG